MIHSLFLINNAGDLFLEKHWKSVISRSVCDYFFEAREKAVEPDNVPPVIRTPHHYLINIYREKIFFVSVIQTEVPPLFVIEFLHRVAETFQAYFDVVEEIDAILDKSGKNILVLIFSLISQLDCSRQCINAMFQELQFLQKSGQLSNIPWRRAGVKYTNNEAYFDVVEEIDAILDKSGTTVFAEIQGVIDACVKLSGMPDLTLSFMNPRLLDDVSFHPCVRYKRWESERVISFIPPDGNFQLMSYHISAQNLVAIPIYVKQNISFFETGSSGRLDITVGPKQTMGKTVECLVVTVHMPKVVLSANLSATQGTYNYDPVTKILLWDIGKLNPQKLPNLKGSLSLQSGAPKPEENPSLNIDLKIQQLAISGLKVNRLDMYGEKYKPFKGVKYVTKAGKFQVRT
uniref:AP-3 complex subunit mu-1 n=1 Tax=Sinocyclocheilus rhinocerous TaxID=307959 RepID=A0A673MBI2_9TELE